VEDYRRIADTLAGDIRSGRLRAGDRLPPQRRFARQHGIATSTAARVYGELVRRGLAVGEVGRGTFVRSAAPASEPALAEPADARIDLELNFPVLPEQNALLAAGLTGVSQPEVLARALDPVTAAGTATAREAAAGLLARGGWRPEPAQLLFAGNGRQAIAAAVATHVPVGGRLGVEALTYPVVKGIAARLGITLVPLPVDGDGIVLDAIRAAHRNAPLHALYCQPTLHNPLGVTVPPARRAALADLVDELDLPVIEDGIYGFLAPDEVPLAALAPDRVVLVDSLSKRLAPGLTLGFAAAPPALTNRLATALRSGGWTAAGFPLHAATGWIENGTVDQIVTAKRLDAEVRQRIVAERLAGFAVTADPRAYHCWWELPEQWRAETFVAAAARQGIAVTPAAAFTTGTGHAPNALRLALGTPTPAALAAALDTLAALAHRTPEDASLD
jgi:DNA-binding transcriptional MocR family regulator